MRSLPGSDCSGSAIRPRGVCPGTTGPAANTAASWQLALTSCVAVKDNTVLGRPLPRGPGPAGPAASCWPCEGVCAPSKCSGVDIGAERSHSHGASQPQPRASRSAWKAEPSTRGAWRRPFRGHGSLGAQTIDASTQTLLRGGPARGCQDCAQQPAQSARKTVSERGEAEWLLYGTPRAMCAGHRGPPFREQLESMACQTFKRVLITDPGLNEARNALNRGRH